LLLGTEAGPLKGSDLPPHEFSSPTEKKERDLVSILPSSTSYPHIFSTSRPHISTILFSILSEGLDPDGIQI